MYERYITRSLPKISSIQYVRALHTQQKVTGYFRLRFPKITENVGDIPKAIEPLICGTSQRMKNLISFSTGD